MLSFDWALANPEFGLSSATATFFLIALAELGDKSQLVCMTLAARHRALPVTLGAVLAFALLNALAVLFGHVLAAWLPETALTLMVAGLFALFGLQALRNAAEDEDDSQTDEARAHTVLIHTFLLIFVAELGDKTQIAVAGLGSTYPPLAVWLGATLALASTSILGIWAGKAWLSRIPMHWVHRVSGVLFLSLAALALSRLLF